jgi:hypothetical protein
MGVWRSDYPGIIREHRGKERPSVRSRCRATASEGVTVDTSACEVQQRAVSNSLINPITNPKHVDNPSRDNIDGNESSVLWSNVEVCWIRSSHSGGYEEFCLLPASRWSLPWVTLRPRRWRRCVPPKRRLTFNWLHAATSLKIELF